MGAEGSLISSGGAGDSSPLPGGEGKVEGGTSVLHGYIQLVINDLGLNRQYLKGPREGNGVKAPKIFSRKHLLFDWKASSVRMSVR